MKNIGSFTSFLSLIHRYPRASEALLIPCLLVAIFWIFLGRFLGGEHSIATWVDNTHLILPLFSHISASFAAGEFPYWINSIAGGIPLYNTPQFSLLYPFYFFVGNFYQSPLDTSLHVHYVTLFHVGILWINTYVMLRIFRLGVVSSVVGATLFAFCANTYQYLFWVNITAPYSWFPLATGAVYLILENRHPVVGLLLGWISIYLLVSASPAQPLIHLTYFAAVLAVAFWLAHRKDRSMRLTALRNVVLLAGGSILLSAAVLIPTLIFSWTDMIRWTDAGPVVGNERIPFEGFLSGQTKARELAKVLFPLNVEQLLGDSYLGVLPVFLALFSVFKLRQNWAVMPLIILGLYTLLSSTGDNLGFAHLNYLIPFWDKIREPGRHLYVFALAACTLAAFGFEHLTRRPDLHWKKHGFVFGVFLVLLLASYRVRQEYDTLIGDSILFGSLLVFIVILIGCRLVPRWGGPGKVLLAMTVIYPLLYYPVHRIIARIDDGDYFTEANLRSHRILQEVANIDGIRRYRLVFSDDQLSSSLWSMNASYYALRSFEGYMNPLPFEQFEQIFFAPQIPRYSQLLGARYYLSCSDDPAAPPDYVLEKQIEDCLLYSTSEARPYYFLSAQLGPAYDERHEFLDLIGQRRSMDVVSVESKNVGEIAAWLGTATEPLIWDVLQEELSGNKLSLELRTNRNSLLILNEYFRGEWKAAINGRNQEPFKVELNQVGVLLPEGTNRVEFEYRPRLFIWLMYLSRASLGVLSVALFVMVFRGMRKSEGPAGEAVEAGEHGP